MKRNAGRGTITGYQTITLEDEGRSDTYDVSYEASAQCVYRPAYISGPPEDCYPDESELNDMEITVTTVCDEQGNEVEKKDDAKTVALWIALENALDTDRIEEAIWEDFMNTRYNEPD